MTERKAAANSTYKKLAVQWLNEALCFVSSLVLADSSVLRNRQLLVAAKRYLQLGDSSRMLSFGANEKIRFLIINKIITY
jgi:hypothetical protein